MYVAILVDGGFYRRVSEKRFGRKPAHERAREIETYCRAHLTDDLTGELFGLYRIFYYDCPPSTKDIMHPLTREIEHLGKTAEFNWASGLHKEIRHLRNFALRLGQLSEPRFVLKDETLKQLFDGRKKFEDISRDDIKLDAPQKAVDMMIGVDIATLALKGQVRRIVLIAGDADFVPAAKLARREGVEFILDPMGNHINEELYEHVDGVITKVAAFATE